MIQVSQRGPTHVRNVCRGSLVLFISIPQNVVVDMDIFVMKNLLLCNIPLMVVQMRNKSGEWACRS